MPKYLPAKRQWKQVVDGYKLKDNGLAKLIDDFRDLREDEYDKRLAMLSQISKLADATRKSKEVIAAGSKVVKMLDDAIEAAAEIRKRVEADQREAQKVGLHAIDVQIMVVDWNGKPLGGDFAGIVEFRSPGVPLVSVADVLTGNGMDIDDLRLRPSGTLYFVVRKKMYTDPYIEGTTDYDFKPGTPVMKFRAIQHSQKFKTRAKTLEEMKKKLGFKGTLGLEFKVAKVGGEVTEESEYMRGYEEEVEWEGEAGLPSFKDFKKV
jgi:hypothetical protein